jgi:hypothetical protein
VLRHVDWCGWRGPNPRPWASEAEAAPLERGALGVLDRVLDRALAVRVTRAKLKFTRFSKLIHTAKNRASKYMQSRQKLLLQKHPKSRTLATQFEPLK